MIQAEAALLARAPLPGRTELWRLHAPEIAKAARPGHYIEVEVAASERLFVMRADAPAGWIELLRPVTNSDAPLTVGRSLAIRGPLGSEFVVHPERPRPLLLGHGLGMAPMIFLASALRGLPVFKPLALLSTDDAFPFTPRPSRIIVPGVPHGVIAAPPLLDDWGVPARLINAHGAPGCHEGDLIALARHWLHALSPAQRGEVEIFVCAPPILLAEICVWAQAERIVWQSCG
ncbi:MAG: dihydroorotate dehydrogenase electron transfer subunit [Pseudomonadota bacterium]